MRQLNYDIYNGQFVNKELKSVWTVTVDCKTAIIIGQFKRRMYDELLECYRDVEAFYLRIGHEEYGVIGWTVNDWIALCRPAQPCRPSAQDDCDPEQIFECQFENIFE